MSENDAILVGANEVAQFMRVSLTGLRRLRSRHPDIPLYQDGARGQLCADKEVLAQWQRRLYTKTVPLNNNKR